MTAGDTTDEETLTVQEAAQRTGLTAHTLRYYEREGLIPAVDRGTGNNHRRYGARDLAVIELLKRMRLTGMPIREMQEYVRLYQAGIETTEARREMLAAHRVRVCERLRETEAALAAIDYKISIYQELAAARPWPHAPAVPTDNLPTTKDTIK